MPPSTMVPASNYHQNWCSLKPRTPIPLSPPPLWNEGEENLLSEMKALQTVEGIKPFSKHSAAPSTPQHRNDRDHDFTARAAQKSVEGCQMGKGIKVAASRQLIAVVLFFIFACLDFNAIYSFRLQHV